MHRSNRRQTAQDCSNQMFSLAWSEKECNAEHSQSSCSQTSAGPESVFETSEGLNRSLLSAVRLYLRVGVCLCACAVQFTCAPFLFWERRWRFGWGVKCHDLTSHESDVELLMIASQRGNSSEQFSEIN